MKILETLFFTPHLKRKSHTLGLWTIPSTGAVVEFQVFCGLLWLQSIQ